MKCVIAVPWTGNDIIKNYFKKKLELCLVRSGAEVKWLDLSSVDGAVGTAVGCSGLLLAGGGDILPSLYGETPDKKCGRPDVVRDAAEPELYRVFVKENKPVFAICRGMQLMNVCEGGNLYQDISEIQTCRHRSYITNNGLCHAVKIERESMLYSLFGLEAVPVNSLHHQAIKSLGNDLKIAAVSEDGFTEAVERTNCSFCLGVQWHPELMYERHPLQRKLFTAFVETCARVGGK